MRKIYTLFFLLGLYSAMRAQLVITGTGITETIDFTGFDGSGFTPVPADGQLSSNTWSVRGFSDGDVLFSDEGLSGDFARGTSLGGETTGGIYAATYSGDVALMVQPNEDDFTPGSIVLRVKNGSGVTLNQLDLEYLLYNLNDEDRSNSLNFSYSYDDVTYFDVPDLNYVSPEAADGSTFFEFKSHSLTGLSILNGDAFYLRWSGNDVSGSGSRDEFALDLIHVTAIDPGVVPSVSFNTSSMTVNETDLTADFAMQISSSSDCVVNFSVSGISTASDGSDYSFSLVSPVEFSSGGDVMQSLSMDLLDDVEDEPDETLVIQIDDVTGTCEIGIPSTITITILDDDATPIPAVNIIDVHGEDGDGVCTSIGDVVSITGIVYGVNLADAGLEFTVIDATAGISVFNAADDLGYSVTEGDKINVIGTIAQFNGLTQIIADTIHVISTGNALKVPDFVGELNEATESDLVKIDGLNYVDETQWLGDGSTFDVEMTNGTDVFVLHIDNNTELSGVPAPHGEIPYTLTITGIGSQNDASAPFDDDYLLSPRYIADFAINQGEAITTPASVNLQLYPNPVTENLTISSDEIIQSIEIMNAMGQSVRTITSDIQQELINVSDLPAGFYSAKLTIDSSIYSISIIKQ